MSEAKTLRIPKTLFRTATFDRSAINEESRTVELSISSDEPYERYFGVEILDHSPKAVNMERLKSGAALLFNHKTDEHLGTILECGLKDGKLRIKAQIGENSDAANRWPDIKSGVLKQASVGYMVDSMVLEEEKKDAPNVYRVTKWTPYEGSLVTIPADFSVGVGRAEARDGERDITLEQKNSIDEPETKPQTAAPAATTRQANSMNTENNAPTIDIELERKNAATAERKRVKDINDYVAGFKVGYMKDEVAKLGLKCVEDGTEFDDFERQVMKNWREQSKITIESEPGDEGRDRDGKRALSIGAQFVRSPEVKALNGKIRKGAGVSVEIPGISTLGIKGKIALAQRAGFTSSDLSAVNVTVDQNIVALGVQRLTIMDVIGDGSIGTGSLKYARENSFGSVDGVAVAAGAMPRAKAVGERGVKPNWDPDLTTETANVSKIAITTKVPDEFLADFPSAMSYIDTRLPLMVDTETEYQILYGDGLSDNLEGIFTTAGVQTRAITTTNDSTIAASLRQGLTDIQVGAQFEPDFFGFHPYDWETAQLLKDDDKRFFAGGPYYIPYTNGVFQERYTLWGKPVVISTAITYGQPIAGAGKIGAAALIREGMRIEMTNSNEDDFKRNLICLRAEHRLALPVYRPVAFIQFTGFPARA